MIKERVLTVPLRACGAGDSIKPGVEPKAEPQEYGVNVHQARDAGGSFLLFANSSSLRLCQWLPPASRAGVINPDRTWGSALSRSTPGFTLTPAPRALEKSF